MGVAIFLLSAAVLLHEVSLLRVLAMAWWHHAASLVVAVALIALNWSELMARYQFWRDFESLGNNEQGYPEFASQPIATS